MENNHNELWQGGPWEQPSRPVLSPLRITVPTPRPPILRPRQRKRRWPAILGGAVLLLILLFCMGRIIAYWPYLSEEFFSPYPHTPEDSPIVSTEPPSIPRAAAGSGVVVTLLPPTDTPLSNTQIYKKCTPSIVSIFSEGPIGGGSGTGIVLTSDGYLLTNAHVVAGASQVEVALHNNQILTAKLVGFDAREDLAVLKVDAQGLTPAQFGDSDALRCGDPVAALGDPLGYRSTITEGIVSALDREISVDDATMTLIQTSAAINFGNSGGALLNQYGQVVGITTIKIVSDDGSAEALGFAIPSTRVKYVADRLIAGQTVRAGAFGFTVGTFPVPSGGLEIYSVDPRSDAFSKGIRPGDILIGANGQEVTGTQTLVHLKLTLGAGDTVRLVFLRGGATYTVDVILTDVAALCD